MTISKLLFIACASVMIASAGLKADVLLSRNAAYRIIGETYLYAGQPLPGTNDRAGNAEGFRPTPLVEMTDSGDALIDGDPKTIIYTPWVWRENCKRITVEMTLPGASKVSRVAVRLPDEPAMRPQDITLEIKSTDVGEWKQVEVVQTGAEAALAPPDTRKASHTFVLDQRECTEVRVICVDQGVMTTQCGIAEIEVYGDGDTTNGPPRGLIRSEPHLKAFTPPVPSRPPGSRSLVQKGKTRVDLSGTPVTSGVARSLIDDDTRRDGLRIDQHSDVGSQLNVDIDLGEAYIIDAINIWLPGGKGAENGHIGDIQLAISASDDPTGWRVPADLTINPYWPDDNAPTPYAIPIANLDSVGRRVRLTARLAGEGGLTRRLAITEIEIVGRTVDAGHSRQASARLDAKPIRFDPEPVGRIRPELQWLTGEKIRGIWAGEELRERFAGTDKTKGQVAVDAGFNLYVNIMSPTKADRSVSSDIDKHLAANVAEARRLGIRYMVVWQYGSNHQEPYPRYRGPDGDIAEKSACPLNEEYFQRHVAGWAITIASAGAEGMIIDTEMYESDQTRYPGPCVCDECFATYLQHFSNDPDTLGNQIKPQRRGAWLTANTLSEHYRDFSIKRLEQLFDTLQQKCHAINPAFLFGHAPGLEYLPGIERGLGTSDVPCLVMSEREYTFGVDETTFTNVESVRQNIPALYLPGFYLVYQTPEMVSDNALTASLYADGWWLYYASSILNWPGTDDAAAYHPGYGRVKGTTAAGYLDSIAEMHGRLDKLLTQPKDQWPKSNSPAPR